MEDYDQGGQHVAYYDKSPGNAGGQYRSDDVDIWWHAPNTFYTGANATGEWLNYNLDVPCRRQLSARHPGGHAEQQPAGACRV